MDFNSTEDQVDELGQPILGQQNQIVDSPVPPPVQPPPTPAAPQPPSYQDQIEQARQEAITQQDQPQEIAQTVPVTSTVTKETQITPEEQRLRKQQADLFQKQQNDLIKSGELAKQQANIEINKQAAQQEAINDYTKSVQDIQTDYNNKYKVAKDEFEKQEKALSGMKVKDYWEDKSIGTKILAALSIGLGQYAVGMGAGGTNIALNIINSQIERDADRQKAAIQMQKDIVQRAGKMTDEVRNQFDMNMLMAENKKAAVLGKVASEFETQLAKLGPDKVGQDQVNLLNQLKQQQLAAKLQVEEGLRTTFQKQMENKVVKLKAGGQSTEQGRQAVKDIRADYLKHPVVQLAREGKAQLTSLESNLKQGTKQGDLAAIFNYAKALDPRSVVREGEQVTIQRTDGVFGILQKYTSMFNQEGSLTPAARKGLLGTVKAQVQAAESELPRIQAEEYLPRTRAYGVHPDLVFGKPSAPSAPAAQQQTSAGPQDTFIGYKIKNKKTGKVSVWDSEKKRYVEEK